MTTVPVSSVPAVVVWLQQQIEAQVVAANVPQCTVVVSSEDRRTTDNVIRVAPDVRRTVQPFTLVGSGGQGWLQEVYDLDIDAQSWAGAPDPVAPMQQAWQLVSLIETAVRQDITLGGNVRESRPVTTRTVGPQWTRDPVGRLCVVTSTIRCFNPL